MKMKRNFAMCFAALMAVSMVACDEKENTEPNNGGNNGGGNTPASLAGTMWYSMEGNPMTEATVAAIEFATETYCAFGVSHYVVTSDTTEDEEILIACVGTYTYDGTNGNIHFMDTTMTQDMGEATFSVSGNTLTLNYRGQTYTLTKGNLPGPGDDPGDDPDPQPGSDEVSNTMWMYTLNIPPASEDDDPIVIVYSVVFTNGYCIFTYNTADDETVQYMGTYQYNATSHSGNGTLTDDNDDSITVSFTVNGNSMNFNYGPETITMTKVEY